MSFCQTCEAISCNAPRRYLSANKTKLRKPRSQDSSNPYQYQRDLGKVCLLISSHLPKVGEHKAISVIIDQFLKYTTFVPTPKQFSAELTA